MASSRKRGFHKWTIDFTGYRKSDRQLLIHQNTELKPPLGFNENLVSVQDHSSKDSDQKLIDKRSWEIALGPLKQIPMNFFIMWMAGNTISIFPIMMVGMMFFKPIQALISIQTTFNVIEGTKTILQKFVYLIGNVVCLGLAVYKCQVMGLLPTHSSDWLAFVEPQQRMEWSGGGMVL
ncbi:ER membrane protein complex subunit 4-like [Argopecten irradians]|uniref:ER membrane protein complex subunit 4-like n=1 Tax=Argopecten irradians TaxID=31199 RepID=UPI00371DFDAB